MTPPHSRIGRVTGFADGFATLENIGTVPVVPGRTVIVGDSAQVLTQPGGQTVCLPIAVSSVSGFATWDYAGDVTGVDPGAGNLAISGTGSNPRTFAVSGVDNTGATRNFGILQVGDSLAVTDDPAAPPVTGFARYVLTSDPVNMGAYWTWTALRTDTSGATTPPPIGTSLRIYATFAGGPVEGGGVPPGPSAWSNYQATTNEISATAWTAFGPSLNIPAQPLGTQLIVSQHAWLVAQTVAGDVRCSIGATGGALWTPGLPAGNTLYKLAPTPSTEQGSMTLRLTVTDATQPTVVQTFGQQAGRNGPGQRQINFIGLTAWRVL